MQPIAHEDGNPAPSLPPPLRPLSIIGQLSSFSSLSSLLPPLAPPSTPYTLLTLPPHWLAHVFSFLSPAEKLIDVSHVTRHIHRTLTHLSSSFHDDFLALPSPALPSLSLSSPWFRGLSGVSAKTSAPSWFELDNATPGGGKGEGREYEVPPASTTAAGCGSPSSAAAVACAASPAARGAGSPFASPFSGIRSLSISLAPSAGGAPSIIDTAERSDMLSGFHKWTSLRHLHITADDTDDTLTTASLDAALFARQPFAPFAVLSHLHTLTLDATVRSDQVEALTAMYSLQCLQMTEREQRIGVSEERWTADEARMMIALGRVSRLVRGGRGLVKLRMPRFHFPTSADGFCEALIDDDLPDAQPSSMTALCLQGAVTRRGVSCLAVLPALTSLTMGWGCELDPHEATLASLPLCRALQHVHVRLVDPLDGDEHDDEYVPSLPALAHVLSIPTLTSLSLHLPPHAWTVSHSVKLAGLHGLKKLSMTGEPSGINSTVPMNRAALLPLASPLADGSMPLQHLKALSLDWLPLTDDALVVLSSLSSLTSLALVNCPYLTSAMFLLLPSLPSLIKLKVYRCDVSLTEEGWAAASKEAERLRATHPHPLPASMFPALQVLECHLVHRLCCDVDWRGFSVFLALLPPSTLHAFDFDSDYSTLQHFLQLEAFPHLRSLGTPCVDVYPYDDDAILRAKDSFRKVERVYYSREFTRIHRGQRRLWRKDRRGSNVLVQSRDAGTAGQDEEEDDVLVDEDEDDDEIDEDDGQRREWREREQRWARHYNGVEFRHREARVAFFDELRRIARDELSDDADVAPSSTDSDSPTASDDVDGSIEWGEGDDSKDETVDEAAEDDSQPLASDSDDDYDDWSDLSPTASLSLVGRSLKLYSRRWKRDERAAITNRRCQPKGVDKSVRRGGRRGSEGQAKAAVSVQRKWDHDLVRVARMASLH